MFITNFACSQDIISPILSKSLHSKTIAQSKLPFNFFVHFIVLEPGINTISSGTGSIEQCETFLPNERSADASARPDPKASPSGDL